jgi:hypothetical protein
VYSVGRTGNLNSYFWPGTTGVAWPAISESRFEESRMPLETRHWVTACVGLVTSR